MRQAIDKRHTRGSILALLEIDVRDDGVGNQRTASCFERVFDGCERTAEVRVSPATALTRAAVMTCRAAVMVFRKNSRAPDRHRMSELLLHLAAHELFAARHHHGREKMTIGERGIVFRRATNPD